MVQDMRGSFNKTVVKVTEDLYMLTVIITKVIGIKVKHMAKVSIRIVLLADPNILEVGLLISSMARVKKYGQMVQFLWEVLFKDSKTVKDNLIGQMVQVTLGNFKKIISMVMVYILGMTCANMKVRGLITKWKVTVFLVGQMDADMKATI